MYMWPVFILPILFSPPQIPPESTGIWEFRWILQELNGIPEFHRNPSESAGIYLQFTIKDLIESVHISCNYSYKGHAPLRIFKVYILLYF
jgi:hypothetical protein